MMLERFVARRRSKRPQFFMLGVLGGATMATVGIALADRGRRVRVRDQLTSSVRHTTEELEKAGRDVKNRMRGTIATVGGLMHPDAPPDDKLTARVRSVLGHVTSHPQAIEVSAHDGHVALSGAILRPEARRLVHAVRKVKGVHDVQSLLDEHESPDGVPSLQGHRRREGARRLMGSPPLRLGMAAIGAAGLAMGAAYSYRRIMGATLATVGSLLVLRSMLGKSRQVRSLRPRPADTEAVVETVEAQTLTPLVDEAAPVGGSAVPR